MANPVLAAVSRNPVLRAGVVGASILTLVGVVSGALPILCYSGVACAAADDISRPVQSIEAPAAPVAAKTVKLAAVVEPQGPTLTHNDVLAATFETLKIDLEALKPTSVSTRTVKTVAIRADGTMVGAPTEVAAIDPVAAVAPSSAEPEAASSSEPATEVAAVDPVASAPVAAKPVSGGKSGIVKGTGVNVRSSPVKGSNTVLFALAGGAKVTIGESKSGWYKITDKAGRSGWVYGDFISR